MESIAIAIIGPLFLQLEINRNLHHLNIQMGKRYTTNIVLVRIARQEFVA